MDALFAELGQEPLGDEARSRCRVEETLRGTLGEDDYGRLVRLAESGGVDQIVNEARRHCLPARVRAASPDIRPARTKTSAWVRGNG